MRKICFITGSRAEYGLLRGLMNAVQNDPALELQVVATNMHLSPEFGLTYREIEKDDFNINKKIEMLLSSDSAQGISKSVGLGMIGFADAFSELSPDLIVILGDRYEMLAVAFVALFHKIPIAHLHGGEITEGAYDDCIRHAISKMSHLHFTSTEVYRKRVIQLGEQPDRVFNVGAIGIDNIKHIPLMSKEELEQSLNFSLGDKFIVVTYHPVTLEDNSAEKQSQALISALNALDGYKILFTYPNSDSNGRVIIDHIKEFVAAQPRKVKAWKSLGIRRYLSALRYAKAVVGNSSSGIIEVPSFHIPTLNIGIRQKGRISANSVFNCEATEKSIKEGLAIILDDDFSTNVKNNNPYEGENTTEKIVDVIKNYPLANLVEKKFYDLSQ
ncbi:UDP-N-acetylglucosamine 2-epimerase (hydrolyzing) [Prevotella brunnea]|uniref:UDP-N-acetylglucosamine 2-epimerase (Hydrolyzing) n=1 Tax=Prevotella brunnea TaxID=2508867 RepID=A0A5C8GK57_9BACT|nr:UDP-N-acetylglucosamine 2-epimerase [Prevotella brunnea]MDR0185534.1 UDP-N-acetylglucosamine 2-epimerase (hydrolyzing) [Prevotella brunnea]TXJ62034.1 UDP-N-acetylglucosamine 2-epimerase (hydrolyzing) [Prevotella brunnea]